jgi:hypothetical protein
MGTIRKIGVRDLPAAAEKAEKMMAKHGMNNKDCNDAIDELLHDILDGRHGDDEQLQAFKQSFEDNVSLPADAFVIGEPVSVAEVEYDGNVRRGLAARCRRGDGSEHVVSAADVVFPEG